MWCFPNVFNIRVVPLFYGRFCASMCLIFQFDFAKTNHIGKLFVWISLFVSKNVWPFVSFHCTRAYRTTYVKYYYNMRATQIRRKQNNNRNNKFIILLRTSIFFSHSFFCVFLFKNAINDQYALLSQCLWILGNLFFPIP